MRLSQLSAIVAAATLILFISQFSLEVYFSNEQSWLLPNPEIKTPEEISKLYEEVTDPVILWWAPLKGVSNFGSHSQCDQLSCFFTDVARFRNHPNFKGYLFYGSSINWTDLPLPRDRSVFWALLHEESPRNNIPLSHQPVISLFNYTSTFSRYSHVPLTTDLHLDSLQSLTAMKYFETVEAKNGYQRNKSSLLAPVVYIQSDCSTPLDRDSYIVELSKYIRVDSFGSCLHNRSLPPHLQWPSHLETMMSDDLLSMVGKYKFAIAFENGVCEDYITEKLWRPLIAGTVPIYIGSPSVADWLPNNRSAILGMNFESPKQLAEHLHFLNNHDDEYDSYRSHKLNSSVTNHRLIQEMRACDGGTNNFIRKFECFLCKKAHEQEPEVSIASRKHYSCEMPTSIVTRQPNATNYWLDWWFQGKCEAEVVRNFIDSGVANYTKKEFDIAILELKRQNKCSYSKENANELLMMQKISYH